jgi:hypothetical protein
VRTTFFAVKVGRLCGKEFASGWTAVGNPISSCGPIRKLDDSETTLESAPAVVLIRQ